MPAAWFGPYIYWQAAIVVLMILLATFYALRKIAKLKEIEALRS
jgi:ABC-type lipoprotein release transport system permease subunit